MATSTSIVNQGTERKDNWQLEPMITFIVFAGFIVYATWRAFMNADFDVPEFNYLSPFYSPYLPHVFEALKLDLGPLERGTGLGWIVSPAIFILWVPAGFRTTCYYYRKAYYRAFFGSPPACAVAPASSGNPLFDLLSNTLGRLLGQGRKYWGEKTFPMVFQNLHRYFFYLAAAFILFLAYDAVVSFFTQGFKDFRIGIGSLVLTLNVILLALYTFSCHSWRHLLGGQMDCFSSCGAIGEARSHAWKRQSLLNEHHMEFAWLSLFSVGFADFYVWMVAKGAWQDLTLFQYHLGWF